MLGMNVGSCTCPWPLSYVTAMWRQIWAERCAVKHMVHGTDSEGWQGAITTKLKRVYPKPRWWNLSQSSLRTWWTSPVTYVNQPNLIVWYLVAKHLNSANHSSQVPANQGCQLISCPIHHTVPEQNKCWEQPARVFLYLSFSLSVHNIAPGEVGRSNYLWSGTLHLLESFVF